MLHQLGKTDVYLIDQLQKGRIRPEMRILDAGCGSGRNSEYFVRNGMDIYGVDSSKVAIEKAREQIEIWNPDFEKGCFFEANLESLPFPDAHFDFIICSAVLHFAKSGKQFKRMFLEMLRVLAPEGTLWFRMTTKHTIEKYAQHIEDGVYRLPDGTTRFLLDRAYLDNIMAAQNLTFLDPFKTVNVDDIRTMATVALKRN